MLLLNALTGFALILLVFGGVILETAGGAKIEFASLDPWVSGLLLIVLLRRWRTGAWPGQNSGLIGRLWQGAHQLLNHPKRSRLYAWVLICAVCLVAFLAHCARHISLRTHGLDLSFIHQPLFHPFTNDVLLKSDMAQSGTTLGDHLSFSLLLLTPLTALLKSDAFVFFLQAAITGGVFWFALTRGPLRRKPELFFFAALLFVTSKTLRSSMIWDFREDLLAYSGLFLALLALERGRIAFYFACLAVALLSKENIFLVTTFMAIPILFAKEIPLSRASKLTLALATVVVSLAYGVVALKVILPHYGGVKGPNPFILRLGAYGATPFEMVTTILVTPSAWFEILSKGFRPSVLRYLATILFPLAFFLRGRSAFIWAVPCLAGFAMNIFLGVGGQVGMAYHYDLIILPFLIFATWIGMSQIDFALPKARTALIVSCFVALAVSGRWPAFYITEYWPTASQRSASAVLNDWTSDDTPIVTERASAQVNHLAKYFALRGMPIERSADEIWSWYQQSYPRTSVIFTRDEPWEIQLQDVLLKNGYSIRKGAFEPAIKILDPASLSVR